MWGRSVRINQKRKIVSAPGLGSETLGPFFPWLLAHTLFHGPELTAGLWYSELGLSCSAETLLIGPRDD